MDCVGVNPGLFAGLWDGFLIAPSFALSIFFDIYVWDPCGKSNWYSTGFVFGIIAMILFASSMISIAFYVFVIALVVWFILLIAKPIAWGMGLCIGALIVLAFYKRYSNGRWRNIKFRLPWTFGRK